MRVAGAVLAAGAGRRMGGPKAELVVAGQRLVDRAVGALVAAGCDPVLAVVRAGVHVPGAVVVVNPAAERGQRSSLELAVAAAEEGGVEALAVILVDQPDVTAADVAAVVAAWRPGRVAVGATHPVVMATESWRAALAVAGPDEGARAYLAARPDLVDRVRRNDARSVADLDTPADVAARESRLGSPSPQARDTFPTGE